MDIKEIEKRVQVYNEAQKSMRELDVLGAYQDGTVQVKDELIIEMSKETRNKYTFTSRDDSDYPYQASLQINGITYFTILTDGEYKEFLEAEYSESITAN